VIGIFGALAFSAVSIHGKVSLRSFASHHFKFAALTVGLSEGSFDFGCSEEALE
jgi:hypothetical protein